MELGILFILGVGIVGGLFGAWIFQRLRIPQVVGYLVLGILIGESGFQLVRESYIVSTLQPLNEVAFGIIGFLVGGELHGSIFKKYGRQFVSILLGEGILAFLLVGIPATLIIYFIVHNWAVAAAAGVVFGAIASATDPASTIDVLWEYRSAGVLTTAIIAIVALDDALAMTLYGLGTSTAQILMHHEGSVFGHVMHTLMELVGAVLLGLFGGVILNRIVRRAKTDKALGVAVGFILLTISISIYFKLDVILATMAIGVALCNLAPSRSKELFRVVRLFSTPIYILFFVLVGARLKLSGMPPWVWALVVTYVLARSIGKMFGSKLGGRISGADKSVQDNLGMALFSQGGVAVALSIQASRHLESITVGELTLGQAVIFTVTATTLIVQLGGPLFTKLAVMRAGEVGRNVTEEDVVESFSVQDVMDGTIAPLGANLPLRKAVSLFSKSEACAYPVVMPDGKIEGLLTFEALKESLVNQDCWDWLVVEDIMQPCTELLQPDSELKQVLHDMHMMQVEVLPVVQDKASARPIGLLDVRRARRIIREELVRRQTATVSG
ncbi:cation:proton antiporter [Verrucomicrobiota bacterium]